MSRLFQLKDMIVIECISSLFFHQFRGTLFWTLLWQAVLMFSYCRCTWNFYDEV